MTTSYRSSASDTEENKTNQEARPARGIARNRPAPMQLQKSLPETEAVHDMLKHKSAGHSVRHVCQTEVWANSWNDCISYPEKTRTVHGKTLKHNVIKRATSHTFSLDAVR